MWMYIAKTIGVFLVSVVLAAAIAVFGVFLLAVAGDSGKHHDDSDSLVQMFIPMVAGLLAIGVFGSTFLVMLRGELESCLFPWLFGFGGAALCTMFLAIACLPK